MWGDAYTLEKDLYGGAWSETWLASRHGQKYVIKSLKHGTFNHPENKEELARYLQYFDEEAKALAKCQHSHIVKIIEKLLLSLENNRPCIVMEYIEGMTLAKWVKKHGQLPPLEAVKYVEQIGNALKEIHHQNYLHHDVKPENIMIRDLKATSGRCEAVLIDLGVARQFIPEMIRSYTFTPGTVGFYPPELELARLEMQKQIFLNPEGEFKLHIEQSESIDVYSLAATLYFMITGKKPQDLPLTIPNYVDRSLHDAIHAGMEKYPTQRPKTIAEWFEVLPLTFRDVWRIEGRVFEFDLNDPDESTHTPSIHFPQGYQLPNSKRVKQKESVVQRQSALPSETDIHLHDKLTEEVLVFLSMAKEIAQTASDLEELSRTIMLESVVQSQSATQGQALTKQVELIAQRSTSLVNVVNQSLQEVFETVASGKTAINTLADSISMLQTGSAQIVQRMRIVDEFIGLVEQFVQDQGQIASLTQVLALNSTLVAARAAEQKDPKQFAGVAREFESIAGQVNDLATETNDRLTICQQRTSQIQTIVTMMDTEVQSLSELASGLTSSVESSQAAFNSIQSATSKVVQIGKGINASNTAITETVASTASYISEIEQLADRTTHLTKSARQVAEAMGDQAQKLLNSIQDFVFNEIYTVE